MNNESRDAAADVCRVMSESQFLYSDALSASSSRDSLLFISVVV